MKKILLFAGLAAAAWWVWKQYTRTDGQTKLAAHLNETEDLARIGKTATNATIDAKAPWATFGTLPWAALRLDPFGPSASSQIATPTFNPRFQ